MSEAFSFNREFDFVRLDRLCRTTGRPAHEWDFYIIKELIDNALDADETVWRKKPTQTPILKVRIEFVNQQLFVQVSNRTKFPVELIPDIFATHQYTSRKAFVKGLTRGALGNALKTLLGIPYALRNRVSGDWKPDQKPLSIICSQQEYLPIYVVDTTKQNISFECQTRSFNKATEGTIISVTLDYFEQEKPRTIDEIKRLAYQYNLCNPHANFQWLVEVEGEEWSVEYEASKNWSNKFRGTAPIQWYSMTAFQDLLGALHRKQVSNQQTDRLSVQTVCSYFGGFDNQDEDIENKDLTATVAIKFRNISLAVDDFESDAAKRLYQIMCFHSPHFKSVQLGCIGLEHIRTVLTNNFSVNSKVFYEIATDKGDEPSLPFVIKASVVALKEGSREIWTAINFTPTYNEPFLRRRLYTPIQLEKAVIGLRELLDAYGLDEDTPVILFLHLICPNVESGEFSKTEINHLPFKQVIGEVLDRLLQGFKQVQEEEELQLEKAIYQALDDILNHVKHNERFVFDQLLEKLRTQLNQDSSFSKWLETPDALSRLRTYIINYQSSNTVLTQRVARPAVETLALPLHPERYFFALAEHISPELLTQHHVNKILYIQVPELEPVIIENDWLCRMDMALLRNPPKLDALRETIVQCVVGCDLPILILHNNDATGHERVKQIKAWLNERNLDENRIIDLGLNSTDSSSTVFQAMKLVELMPNDLAELLLNQLNNLNISIKFLPINVDIRRDISQKFEQLLLSYLWEGVSEKLQMPGLLGLLDRELQFTQQMKEQNLDEQLRYLLQQKSYTKSYATVLNEVVRQFFDNFMGERRADIQGLAQAHLKRLHEGYEQ
ncbi:ATP-binding protein [Scytonema sp. NUACC26]|uniref:ATP-binding protein n=1 Tax=Scytonema sp. NUACC26 TaxID=3140176 RepID=UPI0034DB83EA